MDINDFKCITDTFPNNIDDLVDRLICVSELSTSPICEIEAFIVQNEWNPTIVPLLYRAIYNTRTIFSHRKEDILAALPGQMDWDILADGPGSRVERTFVGRYGYYAQLLESIKNGDFPDGSTIEYPDLNGSGEIMETNNQQYLATSLETMLSVVTPDNYIKETRIPYCKEDAICDIDQIFEFLDTIQKILDRTIPEIIGGIESGAEYEELKRFCDKLFPVIQGKVLVGVEDPFTLYRSLLLMGDQAPSILGKKLKDWVHILILLSKDGPKLCKMNDWYNRALDYWNLKRVEQSRRYDKPDDLIYEIMDVIESELGSKAVNYKKFLEIYVEK